MPYVFLHPRLATIYSSHHTCHLMLLTHSLESRLSQTGAIHLMNLLPNCRDSESVCMYASILSWQQCIDEMTRCKGLVYSIKSPLNVHSFSHCACLQIVNMASSTNTDLFFGFVLCSTLVAMVAVQVASNRQRLQSPSSLRVPTGLGEERAHELQLQMVELTASINNLTSILNRHSENLAASQHSLFPGYSEDFSNDGSGRLSSFESDRIHTINSGASVGSQGSQRACTPSPDVEYEVVKSEDIEVEDVQLEEIHSDAIEPVSEETDPEEHKVKNVKQILARL